LNNDNWITFTECVNFEIYIKKDNIYCDVEIFNGHSYYGYPTNKRFKITIKLELKDLLLFNGAIEHAFQNYLSDEYEKHLKVVKVNWMDKKRKELLI